MNLKNQILIHSELPLSQGGMHLAVTDMTPEEKILFASFWNQTGGFFDHFWSFTTIRKVNGGLPWIIKRFY